MLLLLLVMGSNYVSLQGQYLPAMSAVFGKENRDMAIGTMLGRELEPGMQFVAFGNDWSSTFAYISQRKSLTVPGWLKDRDLVASQPQDFVEKDRLGAVVSCGSSPPGVAGMMSWMSEGRTWKLGEVHGCLFATPDRTPPVQSVTPVQWEGWIDKADLEVRDGMRLLVMAGWVTTVGTSGLTPERLVIAVTSADGQAGYLDTLR